MARLKLTEHRAKQLLLGHAYKGISFGEIMPHSLPKRGRFVVKVDQGVKKRFVQGLVVLNVKAQEIQNVIQPWKKKGYTRFLVEPFFVHDAKEEQYLSLERARDGLRLLFAATGGIHVESHSKKIQSVVLTKKTSLEAVAKKFKIPFPLLSHLVECFEKNAFAFLEINPLVIRGEETFLLDAAVSVDGAGAFFAPSAWQDEDIARPAMHPSEVRVADIAKTTPASLKLKVLHPDGSLFFLLSGGGGSIVIADQAYVRGMEKEIGNYGEYSGAPSREETYLYTREVLDLLLRSRAKRKALVIAGGIANFTDVLATFLGIMDALAEKAEALVRGRVRVFVRRGGPNEIEGLAQMSAFLKREKLLGSIHGSEAIMTKAVDEAIDFVCT